MKVLDCTQCDLCLSRKNIVNGVGNTSSNIMFVGEAPGYYEDKEGIPFVGHSGKLLNYYLDLANMPKDQIYLTNVIKCRPPDNRPPKSVEIEKCKRYLAREIQYIKPNIIVALGSTAASLLVPNFTKIKDFRLRPLVSAKTLIITTYHPSFILQNKLFDLYHSDWNYITKAYQLLCNPFHTSTYDNYK